MTVNPNGRSLPMPTRPKIPFPDIGFGLWIGPGASISYSSGSCCRGKTKLKWKKLKVCGGIGFSIGLKLPVPNIVGEIIGALNWPVPRFPSMPGPAEGDCPPRPRTYLDLGIDAGGSIGGEVEFGEDWSNGSGGYARPPGIPGDLTGLGWRMATICGDIILSVKPDGDCCE